MYISGSLQKAESRNRVVVKIVRILPPSRMPSLYHAKILSYLHARVSNFGENMRMDVAYFHHASRSIEPNACQLGIHSRPCQALTGPIQQVR